MSPSEKYLSLETYKKDGTAVALPVWFAAAPDGTLYVYSEANAYKVKRARNNPQGRIAPCDVRGNVTGAWESATYRIVTDDAEAALAQRLLDEKYGWQKKLLNLFAKFRSTGRAAIAIRVG